MRARVGVEGFSFDSSHYTRINGKCESLHGHTYRLSVEVEGEINPDTGMVIDFTKLKEIVKKVIEEYDHKIIVPKRDLEHITIEGPFETRFKVIDYPEATTEYIALDIAKKIYDEIGLPVTVKLYEGTRNYVVVKYPS
ncbi:MAG: 6-carboxytetrahydropterin synthase [Thermoprotei archaeon]